MDEEEGFAVAQKKVGRLRLQLGVLRDGGWRPNKLGHPAGVELGFRGDLFKSLAGIVYDRVELRPSIYNSLKPETRPYY